MWLFSRQYRRKRRLLINQRRISKLSDVATTPAKVPDGLVLTVLITRKPDPQRGALIHPDYQKYIRPWWTTINRLGIPGVILHDGLREEFLSTSTTESVRFHECQTSELPVLHERHRLIRDHLLTVKDEFVLITDVSDVAFRSDPFALMRQDAGKHRIFVGSEASVIGRSRCLRSEMVSQYGHLHHADRVVVNPGILGGRRTEIVAFLSSLVDEIERHRGRLMGSDMSIVNHVFHNRYSMSEVFTGFPLHSKFRRWEYGTAAAVIHK